MNNCEADRRFEEPAMLTRSLTVFNTSRFDLVLLSTTGTDDIVGVSRMHFRGRCALVLNWLP